MTSSKAACAGECASPPASQCRACPVRTCSRSAAAESAPQGQAAPELEPPPNQAGAGAGTFLFDPPTLTQAKGSTFTVNVMLSGGQNVYSVPVQLNYDPNQLQVVNVSNGGFLSQDGQAVALVHRDDPDDWHAASHGHAASGCRGRFGTGRGGDAHIHGEGAGPVGSDHHSRRSAGSGDAADCDERSAGGDYDSVGRFSVPGSQFSVEIGFGFD